MPLPGNSIWSVLGPIGRTLDVHLVIANHDLLTGHAVDLLVPLAPQDGKALIAADPLGAFQALTLLVTF